MESAFASILPQLGIGALSVLALVYVSKIHSDKMEEKDRLFIGTLQEREEAFRALEREVRTSIMAQLERNSSVMQRTLDRLNITMK